MVSVGSSFFTLSGRPLIGRWGAEAGPIVVWLWGEHDASTDRALSLTLARAIALDSVGLVLDLSEVEFIGTSTLGIIVRARQYLWQRSASLTVRSPSAPARRSLDACGLTDLLSPDAEMADPLTGKALGSWVAVPAVERSGGRPGGSAVVPTHVPEHLGRASALDVHAVSVDRLDDLVT